MPEEICISFSAGMVALLSSFVALGWTGIQHLQHKKAAIHMQKMVKKRK